MFLIFVRISMISLFFKYPLKILRGFPWRFERSFKLVIVRYDNIGIFFSNFDQQYLFNQLVTNDLITGSTIKIALNSTCTFIYWGLLRRIFVEKINSQTIKKH